MSTDSERAVNSNIEKAIIELIDDRVDPTDLLNVTLDLEDTRHRLVLLNDVTDGFGQRISNLYDRFAAYNQWAEKVDGDVRLCKSQFDGLSAQIAGLADLRRKIDTLKSEINELCRAHNARGLNYLRDFLESQLRQMTFRDRIRWLLTGKVRLI